MGIEQLSVIKDMAAAGKAGASAALCAIRSGPLATAAGYPEEPHGDSLADGT
jgi:hypothetical protein